MCMCVCIGLCVYVCVFVHCVLLFLSIWKFGKGDPMRFRCEMCVYLYQGRVGLRGDGNGRRSIRGMGWRWRMEGVEIDGEREWD